LFEHTRPDSATPRQVWIYAAIDNPDKRAALEAKGAHVSLLPNPQGKVDLEALLHDLARREVNELHVEAGHKLNGSLIREGCVDEVLLYLAPQMLGLGSGHGSMGSVRQLISSIAP
jgi:diaminohydroxyphosphoribosylaminopyrimidine deaminase / 5-amino-6-(5-phosphoribosylamino)uracil reductase